MSETIVVVGGGHSGGQALASLRTEGYQGRIVLVAEEAHVPYQRPPLSKDYLAGEVGLERVHLKPPEFYQEAGIELRLHTRVESIDREAKAVTLDDEDTLVYDKLLLATGSVVRRLDLPGGNLPGIHYLRSIDDSQAIRSHFGEAGRMVVVGGGYIGLEVASVAVKQGLAVTVLEMTPQLMGRVVDARIAEFFERAHREAGVDVRTGVSVSGFRGNGAVERVCCSDGSELEADVVVIGVGIGPSTTLAADTGLACDNGIVVDEHGCTSDAAIYACGDCSNHPNRLLGRRLRLESVHNAIAQARNTAANLCGHRKEYAELPWFWSDQYDLKLQVAGLAEDYDDLVLRGDPADRSFSAFYLSGGVVVAVNSVSNPREFMAAKTLITGKAPVASSALADPSVALKDLVAR